ncbi:hypothetical protein B0T16DRAFT_463327 [Cercophora newfieldiana]|uniref:Uncharacterized protein n=1 Tax=Cercophora newfieldiana TaxID=92897 RepID=A0AA40CIJ4_9PEZI|nr:hypothetical protein B0T16DRAFT_463327 [Cercophora newfieldiana]
MAPLQIVLAADHLRNMTMSVAAALAVPASAALPEDAGGWIAEKWQIIWTWISEHWEKLYVWISQPDVWPVILTWMVTFWIVVLIVAGLGFGPMGVIGGSFAAAFQSYMYGGFTPAGGIFATMTSMAMLGVFLPVGLLVAVVIATLVAVIVWLDGVGG